MATAPMSSPPSVVLDASFVVAYCAMESGRYTKAKAQLEQYVNDGWEFFAPGVLVAESLYILCRKLMQDHSLTATEHDQAVKSLEALMRAVKPPLGGEHSLIERAEEIRRGYGCSRSADSIYLALTEQLAASGTAEIVTFDADMQAQANANAPSVNVNFLTP